MRALLANLKQFYRPRAVWFVYAVFGSMVLLSWFELYMLAAASEQAEQEGLLLLVLAAFTIGMVVGGYEGLLLHPPFAACLPGHRMIARKATFLAGVLLSLVASLLLLGRLAQPLFPLSRSALWLESAFCLHLTIFLSGAGLAFTASHAGSISVRLFVALLSLAGYMSVFAAHGWFVGMECLAPGHPVLTTLAAGAAASCTWFLFGRPARLPHKGADHDGWLDRRSCGIFRSGLSRFLLGRMHASAYASAARYVWGALYAWQLRGGGARLELTWLVACSLVSCVVAWYMPLNGGCFIAIAAGWPIIRMHPLPAALLTGGGRWERFVMTMSLMVILGSVLLLTVTLTFATMGLLEPYVPQGGIRASDLQSPHLQPITLRLAILLTALFPISGFLEFAWGERTVRIVLARSVLLFVAAVLAAFKGAWIMAVSPAYTAGGVVLAWLIGAYGVYRVTMTSDLVRR